ncbi:hypothetical protein [Anabaena sp. AL93]|jgi:hypothetical protein|uniref:hypothetical protein n=1 Tax=Anabaena sp. AL93 TaxID=1678133 RepID=UPI0008016D4A|nr:hypothetical protein [Anabaena sp. AL93]OBQ22849.1 MAG: hypothetical protein AN486_01535 [Anabaena sp. AL93]
MPIALYMDVHVPQAITLQLCRRGVDVLTAFDDETQELPDDKLLERLKRVLFTQDIRFRVLAETLQIEGKQFSGLIFGHQLGGTIGQFVKDLEFIAQASEIDECS